MLFFGEKKVTFVKLEQPLGMILGSATRVL